MSIPALIVFKNGQEVDRMVGAGPKDAIKSLLERHV
jgi:thioredoxin 1